MARQRKLTPERRELIKGLLSHYKPGDVHDVQEMLRDLLGDTIQQMLEAEMEEHLGYSRYDYKNKQTDDSRNGYSAKTVVSSVGDILILPVVEGHSVKRVYFFNGGVNDNENPVRQEQEKVFPAVQVRITGPGRTAWGCGSS